MGSGSNLSSGPDSGSTIIHRTRDMPIRKHEIEDLAVESGPYAFPAEYVRDKALLVGRDAIQSMSNW